MCVLDAVAVPASVAGGEAGLDAAVLEADGGHVLIVRRGPRSATESSVASVVGTSARQSFQPVKSTARPSSPRVGAVASSDSQGFSWPSDSVALAPDSSI